MVQLDLNFVGGTLALCRLSQVRISKSVGNCTGILHANACMLRDISDMHVGLGGIAILVLDISYKKIPRYYYLSWFLQNLWIDCSIRVFRSFSLIWFCKYQTFVFNRVAITISSGLKRVSIHGKTVIIPKAIISFH